MLGKCSSRSVPNIAHSIPAKAAQFAARCRDIAVNLCAAAGSVALRTCPFSAPCTRIYISRRVSLRGSGLQALSDRTETSENPILRASAGCDSKTRRMYRTVSSPGSRSNWNLATPVFHTCGTHHSESESISHLSGRNLNLENPLTRAKCYGSVHFRRVWIVLYTTKSGSSIWNTSRNASSSCSNWWPRGDVSYFNHLGHTI